MLAVGWYLDLLVPEAEYQFLGFNDGMNARLLCQTQIKKEYISILPDEGLDTISNVKWNYKHRN